LGSVPKQSELQQPEVSDSALEPQRELDLEEVNDRLGGLGAAEIVQWAADSFGDDLVMSTSFGIQSAVVLHLVTQIRPHLPVIWIDTGYLPPETYQFAEHLTNKLKLNIKVYQAEMSPARMEALHGKLWESDDVAQLNRYDRMRKVEPMQRAVRELGARAWIAGLRAEQTDHRKTLPIVGRQWSRYKIHPILHWSAKDVYDYLTANDLPYHPLFDQGYTTVGDWHSSRPVTADDAHERDTRFGGKKQECGLHLPESEGEAKSRDSSQL
jgi:phosphoadenosine phosphosulfate reductase